MLVNIANLLKIVYYESEVIHQSSEPAPGTTPTGMCVVVSIGSNLSGGVPGTVSVVEVVSEGILGGSLSLLSSEELVAGSEGIVSLVSGEGIDIPSVVGPGLGGGSLLGGVVVGGSSAGSGGLSGSSGIGGDVVKVEGLLGGGVGLSTLSSSSVLSLPGIGGGGSSGIAGSGESVGIPGGGASGLGVGNTSGGGLLSPGTGSGGGLGSGVPGLIGPDGVVEVVVEVSGLVSEVVSVVEVTVEEVGLGVSELMTMTPGTVGEVAVDEAVTVEVAMEAMVAVDAVEAIEAVLTVEAVAVDTMTEAVAEVTTMDTVMAVVTVTVTEVAVVGEVEGAEIHVLTSGGILALLATALLGSLSGGSSRLSLGLAVGPLATAVLLAAHRVGTHHLRTTSGSLELHHRGEHFCC